MWHERPENAGKVERLRKMFKNTPNDVIVNYPRMNSWA